MAKRFNARYTVHLANGNRQNTDIDFDFPEDIGRSTLYMEEKQHRRVSNIIANLTGFSASSIELRELKELENKSSEKHTSEYNSEKARKEQIKSDIAQQKKDDDDLDEYLDRLQGKYGSGKRKKTHSSEEKNLQSGLGNLASGVHSGLGSAISGTLSDIGSLAGKGWDSLNKELDKDVEDNKRKRQAIEEKANEISKIEFGTSANEIQSQIEQLIAYGNTLTSEQNPMKKAVYAKVTFGIMRLKSSGAIEAASFFEKESKKIKPNLWNAFWFWATFSNT